MSERKQQILLAAIEIIVDQGYGNLSMRALARASGIKLGALQYHFKTWEVMLRALVGYIETEYRLTFELMHGNNNSPGIGGILEFLATEPAGGALQVDKLWPQLWAMGQVEPLVGTLVDEIYAEYIQILEQRLVELGSKSPRAEALCLMSMVEGSTLFVGEGRPWEADAEALSAFVKEFYKTKYEKSAE